ncbi:MAG: acylneuraminate cytidylyltransferase family protein [Patescibacteria group bacterium]
MNRNVRILGVITARGGSKGIPGKNIKPLLGKPLLAYTIEAAKKSGVFDRLVLSTDDQIIANVAKEYGCEVPFLRPKTEELAGDKASHLEVMKHAVQWLKSNEEYEPDYVMILQPTSPLRQPEQIKESVDLIQKTGVDSVLSVSEISENFHYRKAMVLNGEGILKLITPTGEPIYKRIARRQDLEKIYWSVGSIYLFKTSLLEKGNFYGEKTAPIFIDPKFVCDINVPADWEVAEKMMRDLQSRK